MLTEIALTPQILDPSCHADSAVWRECLTSLAAGLFPRTAACSVITADLCDGAWLLEAQRFVRDSPSEGAKYAVQSLLTKLKGTLVTRPGACGMWLQDAAEPTWMKELLASHAVEPFRRAVASAACVSQVTPGNPCLASLEEVRHDAFWESISPETTLPLSIPDQVKALRPVLLHADHLALKLPHVRGEERDDTPLAAVLIKSAVTRPEGFRHPEIELHVDSSRYEPQVQINALHGELDGHVPAGTKITLCFRDRFIERLLCGGSHDTSSGRPVTRWRWGISMGHTARHEEGGQELTTWALLRPAEIARRLPEIDRAGLASGRCLTLTF